MQHILDSNEVRTACVEETSVEFFCRINSWIFFMFSLWQ